MKMLIRLEAEVKAGCLLAGMAIHDGWIGVAAPTLATIPGS